METWFTEYMLTISVLTGIFHAKSGKGADIMADRGFTIGILIGCMLLLSAGLVFTWFEIDEYRHGVHSPHRDITEPQRPAPVPELPAVPAPATQPVEPAPDEAEAPADETEDTEPVSPPQPEEPRPRRTR